MSCELIIPSLLKSIEDLTCGFVDSQLDIKILISLVLNIPSLLKSAIGFKSFDTVNNLYNEKSLIRNLS